MNDKKKYFNVLRMNEELSYGGIRTLKIIEDEFDRLVRELEDIKRVASDSYAHDDW